MVSSLIGSMITFDDVTCLIFQHLFFSEQFSVFSGEKLVLSNNGSSAARQKGHRRRLTVSIQLWDKLRTTNTIPIVTYFVCSKHELS